MAKKISWRCVVDAQSTFTFSLALMATRKVSDLLSYDDHGVLGKGADGFVFRGTFDSNAVAVKRVQKAAVAASPVRANNSSDLKRVGADHQERGQDAMRRLDHVNIVKLLHVEQDDYFKYFVLELCAASLDQLYEKDARRYRGPMPAETQVLIQMADGLNHIHRAGLIHRDVKPASILISATEPVVIKLADFGLGKTAKVRGTLSPSAIQATHHWMAPEMLKLDDQSGDAVRGTIESDVFALGLVFFTFLNDGLHLYGGKNLIAANLMNGKQINLAKMPKDHYAYEIICQMTSKHPAARIQLDGVVRQLNQISAI